MATTTSSHRKEKKFNALQSGYELVSNYSQILLVTLSNVGSRQVQMIRRDLDKTNSKLVIGKNTIMRKVIKTRANPLDKKDPNYEFFSKFGAPKPELMILHSALKGKLGLIFTDKATFELMPIINSNKVQTVAKVGTIAPMDVIVPPGPTGMDPSQIGFFHALKITTKINKGQIEILKEVHVCKEGVLVGNSEAAFLKKLNMTPFLYGMELFAVYDNGQMLSKEVASISPADILKQFSAGVSNIVALSLETNIPTEPAVPHLVQNAFKNLLAISCESDYKLEALLKAQQASVKSVSASSGPAKTETKAVVEEEKVEEEDMDMGDMFGDF